MELAASGDPDLLALGANLGIPILTSRQLLEQVGDALEGCWVLRALPSSVVFQNKTLSEMLVAEVTKTDLRKTRYKVESKDDIEKTRQGYKIETANGQVIQLSEEEVETISVVEE